jgi:hypothetical protein
MNAAGYLRLMVPDPLAMNMSNTLPKEKQTNTRLLKRQNQGFGRKLLDLRLIKGILMKIYNQIFGWYNS